jgi:RNA polymerase sigma factor (sigma-70 family)
MMNDDMGLMREYTACQSEQAFETLVSRHVGLVHSAALRQVRNPHLAEDITQTVFIILARKAGSLNPKTILAGWLYQTTRYVSTAALKIQRRRERREQEAHMQATIQQTQTDSAWEQLAPLLDDAMAQLRDKDRDAIVLRYFQNRSLRDVGAMLGMDEYAAQKRVGRAVEKLRSIFVKRGIVSTTAIITGAISVNSVQAAPAVLAKSVTAVAITKGAVASGSALTLIKGTLKLMAWTKARTAIVVGIAAILAVGTTSIVIHYYRSDPFSSTKELSSDEDGQYAKWTGKTPEQVAKTFFEACAHGDWTAAAKFWPPESRYPLGDTFKNLYGGLQVVSLGKPFWGWVGGMKVGGAFVPYVIRLKNGEVKRFQLQVRCDNPERLWYVDGGL